MVEGSVEYISSEGSQDAAEADHPAQFEGPERRHFLHSEQQPSHWRTERCRYACSRTGRCEVTPRIMA